MITRGLAVEQAVRNGSSAALPLVTSGRPAGNPAGVLGAPAFRTARMRFCNPVEIDFDRLCSDYAPLVHALFITLDCVILDPWVPDQPHFPVVRGDQHGECDRIDGDDVSLLGIHVRFWRRLGSEADGARGARS